MYRPVREDRVKILGVWGTHRNIPRWNFEPSDSKQMSLAWMQPEEDIIGNIVN
jgi:hypothetical protein